MALFWMIMPNITTWAYVNDFWFWWIQLPLEWILWLLFQYQFELHLDKDKSWYFPEDENKDK